MVSDGSTRRRGWCSYTEARGEFRFAIGMTYGSPLGHEKFAHHGKDGTRMAISSNPQSIMGGKAWYYENNASIEIIIPAEFPTLPYVGGKLVRITRAKLEKSLARMSRRKKEKKKPYSR